MLGVDFSIFVHSGPVISLEQAASERGQIPDQVVRSILFRVSSTEYAMALMPGPRQISWKALRKHFNTNRLTLADEGEVRQVTGFEIGAVNPFGLPQPMRVLIDKSLLSLASVSLGSGIRGTGLILTTAALIAALPQHEIVDLSSDPR
jgi:prolyl-tRNA editing enzyme YbaK/EbsC (Cys-tRNA(Pro) deacylase)